MSQGKLPPNLWMVIFRRDVHQMKVNGAPRCGGALEIPMSCCMCEPTETAQSLSDDTHAVATRPKWAREHGLHAVCGLLRRWVASLAHRKVLETRTRANVNVRPRPLGAMYRQKMRKRRRKRKEEEIDKEKQDRAKKEKKRKRAREKKKER